MTTRPNSRRAASGIAAALILGAVLAAAESAADDAPVPITPVEAYEHGGRRGLATTQPLQPGDDIVMLIVVGPSGEVVSATPLRGPERLFAEATAAVMAWRYRPFLDEQGRPISVTYRDLLALVTEVRVGTPEMFPEPDPPSDFEIRVETEFCIWRCPVFTVALLGDGTVVFDGESEVLLPGRHIDHIDPGAAADLLAAFRAADFFSLQDSYVAAITDIPSSTIALRVGDRTKTVLDYGGSLVGMPESVELLGNQLMEATSAGKWIWGTPQTIDTLAEEGFDFGSGGAADLLAFTASRPYVGSAAFFRILLDRDVPLWGAWHSWYGFVPIGEAVWNEANEHSLEMSRLLVEAAVERGTLAERTLALPLAHLLGDEALAARLIEAGADPEAGRAHDLLGFAAAVYGDPAWMADVIAKGRQGSPADLDYALLGAAMADRPAMIRQLLDAGADPRARDGTGRSALGIAEAAGFREVVDMLIAPEAR